MADLFAVFSIATSSHAPPTIRTTGIVLLQKRLKIFAQRARFAESDYRHRALDFLFQDLLKVGIETVGTAFGIGSVGRWEMRS